jgi:CDP-6-deoxy-D-xylo-4-hexulose-3-dehydrase
VEFCIQNKIVVLEDNCESLGTIYNGRRAGNYSLAASFSFFVAHHMSTIEGGMVCTDDEEFAEMLTIVRANGWDRNLNAIQKSKWRKKYNIDSEFQAKYTFYDLGFNLRPTEITGFLGNFQMRFLEENINVRELNYLKVAGLIANNFELMQLERSGIEKLSTFALPILCKSKELKKKYMYRFSGAGIEIRPMIAGNMQNQPFYEKYVSDQYSLPGTDFIDQCGFYCGNYPELSVNDMETIMGCLIN